MSQFTSRTTKLHFSMYSSTCTCAFCYLFFNLFISILHSTSSVWNSFDMNQMLSFTVLQHVSAVLHVSVATLSAAVTVSLCQSTLFCSVCQEDTDSQSVSAYGRDSCVYTVNVCSYRWCVSSVGSTATALSNWYGGTAHSWHQTSADCGRLWGRFEELICWKGHLSWILFWVEGWSFWRSDRFPHSL